MATATSCVVDWAVVAGIGQTIVAVAALVYAIWQGKETAKDRHQDRLDAARDLKLRARPKLWGTWKILGDRAEFVLTNAGSGPAIVTRYAVKCNGRVFPDLDVENYANLCAELGIESDSEGHVTALPNSASIPPGAEQRLASFVLKNVPSNFNLNEIPQFIEFDIEGESIYGEKFCEYFTENLREGTCDFGPLVRVRSAQFSTNGWESSI